MKPQAWNRPAHVKHTKVDAPRCPDGSLWIESAMQQDREAFDQKVASRVPDMQIRGVHYQWTWVSA